MEADSHRLGDNRIPNREPADPYATPCYDGKDTNLREEPYCFACRYYEDRIVLSGLKRCSRCKMAWYCDAQCQKTHFKQHRELCNRITKARNRVELATTRLLDSGLLSDDHSGMRRFEENGNWPPEEIADYVDAHSDLAGIYWEAAYECEVKEVWEGALFHSDMVMKVEQHYDLPLCARFPFVLLYLHRDDEAYAYIRYWLKVGINGQKLPYRVEPNCRYLDVFDESIEFEELDLHLPYLVALAIIKMRIIAYHDAISRSIDFAFQHTGVERIQEVRLVVQEMLVDNEVDIADQRRQLHRVFDALETDRPNMLNFVLECELISELRQMKNVDKALDGVACILVKASIGNGMRCIFRVPGAADMLRTFIAGGTSG